jgi:hypothetical protein
LDVGLGVDALKVGLQADLGKKLLIHVGTQASAKDKYIACIRGNVQRSGGRQDSR